ETYPPSHPPCRPDRGYHPAGPPAARPGTRRGGRPRPGSGLPVWLPASDPAPGSGPAPGFRSGSWLPIRLLALAWLLASGPPPGPGGGRNGARRAAGAVGIPSARCGGVAAGVFPARWAEPVRRGRGGGDAGGREVAALCGWRCAVRLPSAGARAGRPAPFRGSEAMVAAGFVVVIAGCFLALAVPAPLTGPRAAVLAVVVGGVSAAARGPLGALVPPRVGRLFCGGFPAGRAGGPRRHRPGQPARRAPRP